MSKKVFFIVGEPSGDALGAKLIKSMQALSSEPIEFTGIGGPLMEATGVFKSQLPMEELCVMGIWEVLAQISRLKKLILGVVEEIEEQNPDLLITIDLPDFNFHVGRILKEREFAKTRHVHYVAPSVWAWRPGRAGKIASFLDGLLCLFPFEPDYFAPHGLKAIYAGHPMTTAYQAEPDVSAFKDRYNIPQDAPILGLFFGSRISEIKTHSKTLKQAVQVLKEQFPNLHVIVPTLQQLEYHILNEVSDLDCPSFVVTNQEAKWQAFAACDAAMAVSGTVGLELAYAGVPHVIAYKTHPLTWLAVRFMVKTKYAHLANIMLNKEVVPEFLQGKCKPLDLAKGVYRLMKSEKARARQARGTKELHDLLRLEGGLSPGMKAAGFALEALELEPRTTKPKPVAEVKEEAPKIQDEQSSEPESAGTNSLMSKINNAKTTYPILGPVLDPLLEKIGAYQAKVAAGKQQ